MIRPRYIKSPLFSKAIHGEYTMKQRISRKDKDKQRTQRREVMMECACNQIRIYKLIRLLSMNIMIVKTTGRHSKKLRQL